MDQSMRPQADGLISQNPEDAKQCQGMAILDTGASRSVIGQDHVPIMLSKLPATVREQVVEQPWFWFWKHSSCI